MDFIPLGYFSSALSLQRRANAYELLESNCLSQQEICQIESGLFKFDLMWYSNRFGYLAFWYLVCKGRMVDRFSVHTLSVTRTFFIFYLSMEYLFLGDLLSGSVLWDEYKYIFYKYEPQIRKQKIQKYPKFLYK